MLHKKTLLAAFIAVTTLLPAVAIAGAIDAGLSIVGSIAGNAEPVDAANTYTESLYSTVGGATTGGAVSNVALTDTGDGWGHSANLTGDSTATDTLFSQYDYSAFNGTGDTYELTFGITYDHTADANAGDLDARAISRLDAGIPFGDGGTTVEYLDLELESESGDDYALTHPTWQDRVNTVYVGTNGATLNEAATVYYTIELLAGETMNFEAEYLLSGRRFDAGADFLVDNNMFIFLDSFENTSIPEPASLLLLLTGLFGLSMRR